MKKDPPKKEKHIQYRCPKCGAPMATFISKSEHLDDDGLTQALATRLKRCINPSCGHTIPREAYGDL